MTEHILWRKSSYSGQDSSCVEVGWRKSSHSGEESSCIEVDMSRDAVAVRDTKDRDGGTLQFSQHQWTAFVSRLRTAPFV